MKHAKPSPQMIQVRHSHHNYRIRAVFWGGLSITAFSILIRFLDVHSELSLYLTQLVRSFPIWR